MQECQQISEQILVYASEGAPLDNLEEVGGDDDIMTDSCTQNASRTSCNGGQALDKEALAAIVQQNQSWRDLGHEAAAIVDMSVYSLLALIVEDCV
jgi:hypothetical protein